MVYSKVIENKLGFLTLWGHINTHAPTNKEKRGECSNQLNHYKNTGKR